MDLIEVTITALGSEGQGIGALPSGKTCFASGVFPGEKCHCEVISETSKYAVCEVIEVIEESPDRIFHLHQEAFEFLFTFCHKDGVFCISEVIEISPF